MSKTVAITSDTKGKLKKIVEGVVYSDPLVFITELFQNSQRAEATEVVIIHKEDSFTFRDNGCGLSDPKDLLTLDYSSWESTDEGYGIGFWSVLAIEGLQSIEVRSGIYHITINVPEILENDVPAAVVEKCETYEQGFSVILKSEYFKQNSIKVKNRVFSDGELMEYDVYYNGSKVIKKNLFDEVEGDFVKEYHNPLFDAKLAIAESSLASPEIYYEKRFVGKVEFYYLDGVIELKKGALNLREPDRKAYARDEKLSAFNEILMECAKDLYLSFLKTTDDSGINQYSDGIDHYLSTDDYEKFLFIDDEVIIQQSAERNISELSETMDRGNAVKALIDHIQKVSESSQLSFLENEINEADNAKLLVLLNNLSDDDYVWVKVGEVEYDNCYCGWSGELDEEALRNMEVLVIGNVRYEKRRRDEVARFEEDDSIEESRMFIAQSKKKKKKVRLVDKIKKYRKAVWLDSYELTEFEDLKAKAEYYNIKILVAKNTLYRNVYKKYHIPHITELKYGIKRTFIKQNVCLKTAKEESFMRILVSICNYFKLPIDTFYIADLSELIEVCLNSKIVDREVLENKRNKIVVYGMCQDDKIYLDRKALGLNRFNLSGSNEKMGINEIKAVFVNLNTIAHELAHLLYKTEDNTAEHFSKTEELEREIANLIVAL